MDFRPIRNKLKTFTSNSISNEILLILKEIEINEKLVLPFWHLLLLLKWNLEFSDKKYKSKIANRNDIRKLLNQVDKLESSHQAFNFKGGYELNKTMTILAHQQFLYQINANWETFARQLIIFTELKHKYDIKESFKRLTKIDLEEFIKIIFVVYITSFITGEKSDSKFIYRGYLTDEVKNIIIQAFGIETFNNYIKLQHISQENIEEVIYEDNRLLKNYNLQPFEASIFTRKPFFKYNNKYIIPFKDILKHNFNHFIYEYLKNTDDKFTTELGMRMEKYVKLGLDEIKIKYKTENQLKKILGVGKNLVDFLIDENILIEVKAIEVKPYVSINPKDEVLAKEFKKNIVKAYATQMINVAKNLSQKNTYYGIIITYKKLFLGNSEDIWKQFLETESQKICSPNELKIVPFKNLFLIDIEGWDILIQILKNGKYSLIEILENIKDLDSNPKTKKFNMTMHLIDDYNFTNINLSYLLNTYDKMKFENKKASV